MKPIYQSLSRYMTRLILARRMTKFARIIQRMLGRSGPLPKPGRKPRRPVPRSKVRTLEKATRRSARGLHPSKPRNAPLKPADSPSSPGSLSSETGAFLLSSYIHAGRGLAFKLYSPPGPPEQPLPLVVMLHGCKQDPDDFASGTGMNERARDQGFYVLYPAQSQVANPLRCWNWFKHNHQQRGRGEPALIAGMTQMVMRKHAIDPSRVYVAGLSAGGAMAAIVASLYPDIFAAVGVHSGLAAGAADNVMEALDVMKNGSRTGVVAAQTGRPPVPTIVFHGDQDATVHPSNGEQVISSVVEDAAGVEPVLVAADARPEVEQGVSRQGQKYTLSRYRDRSGEVIAEHWVLHGAGHAWSGGDPAGSFTDAGGPDATGKMLEFFFAHPAKASH